MKKKGFLSSNTCLIPGKERQAVDIDNLRKTTTSALTVLTIVIFTACVYPQVNPACAIDTNRTSSQYKPTEVVIDKHATKLTADKNRNLNIALARKAINGRVVYPGQNFLVQ